MPAPSPAISATPRRPPTAFRRCWSSTPRSRSPRLRQAARCRCETSFCGNRQTALAAGRNGDRDPRAQDIAGRRIVVLQARRAALSRHLDRHGGGADRARRRRQRRRGGDRGRRLLGGGPAAARRWRASCVGKQPCARRSDGSPRRHFADLTPIDDVRGSAEYRRDAAREIVSRALAATAERSAPGSKPAKERAA